MKFTLYTTLVALLAVSLGLGSCTKDKCEREVTYIKQTPIFKSISEIRTDIKTVSPRELKNPGKIYFYENFIFINEQREGIHIIDNSNPNSPVNLAFIEIPGNIDMAVQNNILYADNYVDLLSIDITAPSNPQLMGRAENIFPSLGQNAAGDLLVYYHQERVTEMMECENANQFFERWTARSDIFAVFDGGGFSSKVNSGANTTGVGGSMARFTITQNHLYVVDQANLWVFNLSNPIKPSLINQMGIGWNIETIFPYQDKLFIGSNSGMFIFDNSVPSSPQWMSQIVHVTGCDPVYVKDNYAYVTIHSGTTCNGDELNQLDLINIRDPKNPVLEKSFPMQHPHGLSLKDNTLFLCEGKHGLKVFDIEKPLELDKHQISHRRDGFAYDVIVVPSQENVLLLIGADGFYQYNFDDPTNLKLLSSIPVKN